MPRRIYRNLRRNDFVQIDLIKDEPITPVMAGTRVSEDWTVYADVKAAIGSRGLTEYLVLHNRTSGQRIKLQLQPEKPRLHDIQVFNAANDEIRKDDSVLYCPDVKEGKITWVGSDRNLRYCDESDLFVRYANHTFVALGLFMDHDVLQRAMYDYFDEFPGIHHHYDEMVKHIKTLLGVHDIGVAPAAHPFVKVKPVGLND